MGLFKKIRLLHSATFVGSLLLSLCVQASLCKYKQFSDSYRNTYIFHNILDNLSEELKGNALTIDEKSFRRSFDTAYNQSIKACKDTQQSYPPLKEDDPILIQEQNIYFKYNGYPHKIELHQTRSGQMAFSYLPLYGSHQEIVRFQAAYNAQGKRVFSRILGRTAEDTSIRLTNYIFDENAQHTHSFPNARPMSFEVKSLEAIYGSPNTPFIKKPDIVVGIIGTGVDYNHPFIAKHLVDRDKKEDLRVKRELLTYKLLRQPYYEVDSLLKDKEDLTDLKQQTQLPHWMDQALGTGFPVDEILPRYLQTNFKYPHHETRMLSRIVSSQKNIGAISVRRGFHPRLTIDLEKVFSEFDKKGVQVVNLSFGYACGVSPSEEASWENIFKLYPHMIFVVASGNRGQNLDIAKHCPAYFSQFYDNVISVTALDSQLNLATLSGGPVNYGQTIDIAVMAQDLPVVFPYNLKIQKNFYTSTSIAAAEVTRIITEAILEGVDLNGGNAKALLKAASIHQPGLKDVVSTSGYLNEQVLKSFKTHH